MNNDELRKRTAEAIRLIVCALRTASVHTGSLELYIDSMADQAEEQAEAIWPEGEDPDDDPEDDDEPLVCPDGYGEVECGMRHGTDLLEEEIEGD